MSERCVDISVEHTEEIESHAHNDAEVTVASIIVLATSESAFEPRLVEVCFIGGGREEIHIAVGSRVVIEQVAVPLGIVLVLGIVPVGGIP